MTAMRGASSSPVIRLLPVHWLLVCWLLLIGQAIDQVIAQPAADTATAAPDVPLNGTLTMVGSDTMAELMQAWSEQLTRRHPGIRIQLHASGSSTAPPALIRGTASIGAMSRPMTAREQRDFTSEHGYPPVELTVALDAIAVIVHQDNPLQRLTMQQLAATFSATAHCHGLRGIARWQDLLALQPEPTAPTNQHLSGRSIQRFGRNAASGTYQWFRQQALCDADYLNSVNSLPGNGAIVTAVEQSANGIGYAGVAFLTAGVKAVALSAADGPGVFPTPQSIRTGRYPLTRRLYLYANRPPGRRFIPEVQALLQLIYSPDGQATVVRVGLVALPDELVQQAMQTHQLDG